MLQRVSVVDKVLGVVDWARRWDKLLVGVANL